MLPARVLFRFIALPAAILCCLPSSPATAAQLKEARVSQVVKDVKLLPNQAAPRPANVSDEVRDGTAVRTGVDSRAELTFTDATLARLGANTIFSFNEGTRNLDLGGGAMLLRVPKNAGGAKINTAAVTAAITGTTIMLEYHPDAYIKFIVLEGTGRIYRNNRIGESVLLHAGQMLILNPKGEGMPDPVDVDLERLLRTSLLINGFRPLPSNDLIAREIRDQVEKMSEGELVNTNLVIFGRGTAVTLLDPTSSGILDQANANDVRENGSAAPTTSPRQTPTPTPTATVSPTPTISPTPTVTPSASPTPTVSPTPSVSPTPDKFGTPPVITSPDPYVITDGTVINTDPTITTNDQTDFGKIYRGPTEDGTPSAYLFGATSEFDNSSGFNDHFSDASNTPMATFKFSSLVLSGNPTIDIGAGGATNLALISVGDLSSGTAPATLTFDGIQSLLLATQNGNITLGSNITFENIPTLFVYARGAGSTLSFDSTVTGSSNFVLLSENDLLFNNELVLTETGTDEGGLNVYFDAGNNLTATNGLAITLASAQNAADFADISVSAGGNITVGGEDGLHFTIDNTSGDLGGEANIGVFANGDINASAISLTIENNDGSISGDGGIFLSAGGDITTAGDLTLSINGNEGEAEGGSFGGSAYLVTQAGNVTANGNLTSAISLQGFGGAASALNEMLLSGNLTSDGGISFTIANGFDDPTLPANGTQIGGTATILVNAASITSSGDFNATLTSVNGGNITGDATVSVTTTGAITLGGGASPVPAFYTQVISNTSFYGAPGSIGGDAALVLAAGSFSTTNDFDLEISNQSGASIGGNASINIDVGGALDVGGFATIQIDNRSLNTDSLLVQRNASSLGGGSITGDALINVTAGSFSATSLYAAIDNTDGILGGDASIVFNVGGALSTQNDANVMIYNNAGETGGTITINAGSIDIGGYLTVGVFSGNNRVLLNDNVNLIADGNINVSGDLTVDGNVTAGGDITVGNTLSLPRVMSAGGSITSSTIFGQELDAVGDIIVRSLDDSTPEVFACTLTAGGNINFVNVLDVMSDGSSSTSEFGNTPNDVTLTASAIVSTGPNIPVLRGDGADAVEGGTANNPGNGGNLTINLTNGGLVLDSAEGTFSSITANGGAFVSNSVSGGNGGHVTINATDDVSVIGGDISATTGDLGSSGLEMAGDGGTVDITSTNGTIDVGSTILVSSNDAAPPTPTPTPPPVVRRSAKGGNIHLTSNRSTGVAINIENTGQLLALLDAAAPAANGGTITILATGANSEIDVKGTVTADKGTIDIEHTGANGEIHLGGTTNDNLNAHADVIKVGALGANGVLTVGRGTLTADSVLKLYAPSSNGEINFIANATLSSGSSTILAAGTITIQPRVVVDIEGNGGPAQIYTNNPNYSGFGGTNDNNGTFGGNGAAPPQPLASRPPFNPGGG